MLERSQWNGVLPLTAINLNSLYTALWNVRGMCLSKTPGIMSGPGILLLSSWWRASWKITGILLPIFRCWVGGGPVGIAKPREGV